MKALIVILKQQTPSYWWTVWWCLWKTNYLWFLKCVCWMMYSNIFVYFFAFSWIFIIWIAFKLFNRWLLVGFYNFVHWVLFLFFFRRTSWKTRKYILKFKSWCIVKLFAQKFFITCVIKRLWVINGFGNYSIIIFNMTKTI